jgi:uncharacterized protein DUF4153
MALTTLEGALATTDAPAPTSERRARARRVLVDALFLGTLADSLLRQGFGMGLAFWVSVFAVITVYFARRRGTVRREQIGWLLAALFFAGCFALRNSGELLFYDFVALAGTLLLAGATLTPSSPMNTILGHRLRDVALGLGFTFGRSIAQIVSAVHDSQPGTIRDWRIGRAGRVVRGVAISLPILVIFALLFASADPLFGAMFALPDIDIGTLLTHFIVIGFFTWLSAGWLYGAFGDEAKERAPRKARGSWLLTLGTTDVTTLLGGVVLLFGLFVGVQIRWLSGGEQLVHATTGLSYAQYARHGFFELVCVSLLVLPVLVGTRALIADEDANAIRRHRTLALPLLVLVAGVMASALGRMTLYLRYYGLSTDRLYAGVFMIWLAFVFLWFGLTVLRGRLRDFAAGMAISGFVGLASLNLANPEAFVARVNIGRAANARRLNDSRVTRTPDDGRFTQSSTPSPIDYPYLTVGLRADAVPEVVAALRAAPTAPADSRSHENEVRARCVAVRELLKAWGPGAPQKDWRLWDYGAERARRVVRANEAALRAVTCWDSAGEHPFGMREGRQALPGEQREVTPDH